MIAFYDKNGKAYHVGEYVLIENSEINFVFPAQIVDLEEGEGYFIHTLGALQDLDVFTRNPSCKFYKLQKQGNVFYHNGDILNIPNGIICQQVNCQGVMGTGLAKEIYQKYPIVKTSYLEFCKQTPINKRFGEFQIIDINQKLKVANIFSQYNYGTTQKTEENYTFYTVLVDCIEKICQIYYPWTIFIPWRIGCDLPGGNWNNDIKPMLEKLNLANLVCVKRNEDK